MKKKTIKHFRMISPVQLYQYWREKKTYGHFTSLFFIKKKRYFLARSTGNMQSNHIFFRFIAGFVGLKEKFLFFSLILSQNRVLVIQSSCATCFFLIKYAFLQFFCSFL